MTSPHPQYLQPGPSSLPYPPPQPHGGNASYQLPQQHHAPPRIVNGVGYHHQGHHPPRPAYLPHYLPPQPYPGYFLDHRQPYERHHINGGPMHISRIPHSPNRPTQSNPLRYSAEPFAPPHTRHYTHLSPGCSPSALPKQLLMDRPQSPIQHPLSSKPAPDVQPELPPPLPESNQSPIPPSSVVQSSPVAAPSSPVQTHLLSPGNRTVIPIDELSSPVPLSPKLSSKSHLEPPAPYKPFPERSNSTYSVRSRRPNVLAAVAVTVSSAARPSPIYYDLTAPEPMEALSSKARPVSPEPAPAPTVTKSSPVPDSPPQLSLTSSATSTTSTSTHTPIPGSPVSSVTSVSLLTTSPASKLLGSPAASVVALSTDAPEADPNPTPKKSWASLFRPASTAGSGSISPTTPNGLPTSSVQGFSIPATTLTPAKTSGLSTALVTLLTESHVLAGPVSSFRARGLVNLGNMCFANAVLQVLVFCPPFYWFFVELKRTPRGEAKRATPLIDATMEFVKEFQVPTKLQEDEDTECNAFVPTCVYDALKEKKRFDSMRGGQQEDAEEFLGFYLDALEEELLSMMASLRPSKVPVPVEERPERNIQEEGWLEVGKKNKSIITRTHMSQESLISRIFGGRSRTTLRVPGTRESVILEPWSRLQLDIQPDYVYTIEDALRHGATPGIVQVARLGAHGDANQQTLIDALPPVLVLHLKRFLYDTTVGGVVKLRKRVAFGTELEVPKEVMAPARRARPHKYQLFGILNHHGGSATGGHYTLDVLHPSGREGWLRIDDEFVQHIREEDLQTLDTEDERTAYLLFYQRITPLGPKM